jgi:hypothetical protein
MKHRTARLSLGIISIGLLAGFAPTTYQAEYLETSRGWGTAVADYDGDGHADVFITGHDGPRDRIWYWTAQGYGHNKSAKLSQADRHDCDAADVDGDQDMDFYCAIGAVGGTGSGDNELWLQQGGVFTKKTGHGAEDSLGSGRRPIFFDFDGDGLPDIYLTNEKHDGGNESKNRLFLNKGDARFEEISTVATGSLGWACVAKGDIDGDGREDLLVCNHDAQGQSSIFLSNLPNDFTSITPRAVVNKHWTWAQLYDVDKNGKPDLISLVDGSAVEVWLNSGTGKPGDQYFEKRTWIGSLPDIGKSLTVGDFDGDGRPDIYVALAAEGCQDSQPDAADVVFWGRANNEWQKERLVQSYTGCGHEVQTLDDRKVLLVNGTSSSQGPNYVLSWP